MKRIIAAAVIAVVAVGTGSSVGAYPPEAPDIEVDDGDGATSPEPGGTVEVSARCVVPEDVLFTFEDQTATETCEPATTGFAGTPDRFTQAVEFNGVATATFIAPATPGVYTVTAQLLTTGITLTAQVTVQVAPTTPPLPPTGGGDGARTAVLVAGVLMAMGAAMFAVARSRRRTATT